MWTNLLESAVDLFFHVRRKQDESRLMREALVRRLLREEFEAEEERKRNAPLGSK